MNSAGILSARPLDVLRREEHATELVRLEQAAERVELPCGEGTMVWRRWGDGEPIVLLHGGSGSWNHWLRTIPALVEKGRTVWAPDLPGLGESSMPVSTRSADDCAVPVAQGIERLLPAGARFDLAAFSMGCSFTVPLAQQFATRVRRLVLVGANLYGLISQEMFPTRERRLEDEQDRLAAIHENFRVIMLHDRAAIDELALAMQHDNLARRRLSAKKITDFEPIHQAVRALPAGIALHAINGSNDVVLFGRLDEQAAAVAQLPARGQFHPIDGGSHWVMYDRAAAFNRCLIGLLDG